MRTEPKFTPWFPVTAKPARVGVYEVKSSLGASYWSLFNGYAWCGCWATPERAIQLGNPCFGMDRDSRWRGLAQDPKEPS